MKSFVLDKEIDLLESQSDAGKSSTDLLNTMPYVNTLTESVMNAPEDKTFNIGLFGEWGSGKSSIIKTFKRKIDERYKAENKKVKVITYDAWKYSNDSFRRMFLLQMQQDLGFEREELMNKFYLNSSEDAHIDTKINKRKLFLGVLVVIAVIFAVNNFGLTTDQKIVANALVALGSLVLAVIYGSFREVKVNIQRPHLFAPEQFEDCFNEMCDKAHQPSDKPLSYLKWIKGDKGESGIDRLVIVIDNVDRCSSKLAYELLTNIKNFLGSKHNTIFIIPVDEDALKRHFEPKQGTQPDDSAEFLRKFFNICIRIKPFKRDEMFDFADAINKKYELGFDSTTVSLVANEFAHNPRRIIQMFNNLSVELQSLPKEYDEKHQALVCLLLIIREEYNDYYASIQAEPLSLISRERRAKAPEGVKDFLNLNGAVIDSYANNIFVVERLLSNSPIEDKIPQSLKNDYQKMTYSKESLDYIADANHRTSLMHYVENKLKLAIKRELWETDVKNTVDRLIALNKAIHLSKAENLRVSGLLTTGNHFDKIAEKQPNLHNLIDYAAQLEGQEISSVANRLSSHIQGNGVEGEKYKERVDIWYACSKLSNNVIKPLEKVILAACKANIKGFMTHEYSKDNTKVVYSDEVLSYILSQMNSNEDDVNTVMRHVASKIELSSNNLSAYVKALTEVTPDYDFSQNNTAELQKRLASMNQMLALCKNVRLSGKEAQGIKDFYQKFASETTVTSRNYPQSTTQRGFIIDNSGQANIISDVLEFFRLSSIITKDTILHPQTVKFILDLNSHNDELINIVEELHDGGYPVENYSDPLLSLSSYSEKQLVLLDYLLKLKKADGAYYINDDNVKNEIEKLLAFILDEKNGDTKAQIDAIKLLVEDERNAKVLTSILIAKDKKWLLSLPEELIGYAISVFEANIEDYKDQQNVLTLLAAKGSSKGRKAVVRIANSKINDDKQRNQGVEIIKSFEHLSASDSRPLVSSLEFIKENNPELVETADDCLKHLEEIKNSK